MKKQPETFLHRAWRYSRPVFIAVAAVVVLLVGLRLAAPSLIRSQINKRLAAIPDYSGQVESVHLAIWRGAYALRGVEIVKRNGAVSEPFFSAENIDLSLAWRELIRGKVVCDVTAEKPRVHFVRAKSPEASQLEADRRWQEVIGDLVPVEVTYLRVNEGDIHFMDKSIEPEVDVFVTNLNLVATGLRNRPSDDGAEFPANIVMQGKTNGKGTITATANIEPLAEKPHFEVRAAVESVSLPELNRFLQAYGNVDVSKGDFKMYVEMAAKDGRFEGYVKPFLTDIEFKDLKDDKKGALQHFWEIIVSGVVNLVKNKERDQLAARIPFAGEFGSTEIGFWATVRSVFRHGFVKALPAALEHSVKSRDIPAAPEPVKAPTKIPDDPAPRAAEPAAKK